MIETTYSQPIVRGGEVEDRVKRWWQSLRTIPGASHSHVGDGDERLTRSFRDEQFRDSIDMIQRKGFFEREQTDVGVGPSEESGKERESGRFECCHPSAVTRNIFACGCPDMEQGAIDARNFHLIGKYNLHLTVV
ncbi:hypothetical protein BLNAU_14176 [Blattamonas nauphoetae]|uniref:Uncharacterized protein n=1 Tax=Blattamonas nauphoetae TaxID=2049346 RepID=A0ABQ9XJ88_9EUKA|nr:hypothetical protein BLNAU_14176 [Blattamonas nauphoetae]